MVEVIVAVVSSLGTLLGVIITVKKNTDLTLYRIEQLEKKQDKHNGLIERMFKVEDRLDLAEERQKVTNNRLKDLEHKTES